MADSDQNKRKFPRATYPCSLTLWRGGDFETIMATTSNIGAGGLLIHMDHSFMIGAKVEIKIDFSNEEFHCNGLVLRCQPNRENVDEQSGMYSVAIVFEGLDEQKAAYLRNLVDKLFERESNNLI
jgi:hypothetical protein